MPTALENLEQLQRIGSQQRALTGRGISPTAMAGFGRGLQAAELEESARRRALTLQEQQLAAQKEQFGQQLEFQKGSFASEQDLRRQQLATQQSQFGQQLALQQSQFDQQKLTAAISAPFQIAGGLGWLEALTRGGTGQPGWVTSAAGSLKNWFTGGGSGEGMIDVTPGSADEAALNAPFMPEGGGGMGPALGAAPAAAAPFLPTGAPALATTTPLAPFAATSGMPTGGTAAMGGVEAVEGLSAPLAGGTATGATGIGGWAAAAAPYAAVTAALAIAGVGSEFWAPRGRGPEYNALLGTPGYGGEELKLAVASGGYDVRWPEADEILQTNRVGVQALRDSGLRADLPEAYSFLKAVNSNPWFRTENLAASFSAQTGLPNTPQTFITYAGEFENWYRSQPEYQRVVSNAKSAQYVFNLYA